MCGGGGQKKPDVTGPPVTNDYNEYMASQRQAAVSQTQPTQPSFGSELTGGATSTATTGG